MYNWIYILRPYIEKEICKDFFLYPATEVELNGVENILDIKLPESYKNFLRICGGAQISSLKLFNIIELLNFARESLFKPLSQESNSPLKTVEFKTNSNGCPLHFLVFAQMDSLSYCFNTSELVDGEYSICVFEEDNEIEETLRVYSKSFDRFILNEIKEQTDWWEMPESWHQKTDFMDKVSTLTRMRNS